MSALSLLLLAIPWPAEQSTELGTVEFAAGPGRGHARFYLVNSEPRVDVSIRNDTTAPIWWRRGMSESYSYGWIVEPVAVSGEPVQHDSGALCVNIASAVSALNWEQILPGALSKSWEVRPVLDPFVENPQEVPPLDRWAWWHPFVLPRDSAPSRDHPGLSTNIVLAWSRETGPRVFLDEQGSVFFSHFDPFADEPFQRGLGPIAFTCGPLQGTALLRYEKDWPVVEWTLTNPLEREVFWSVSGVGSLLTWGFIIVDYQTGKQIDRAWRYKAGLHRAHGRFAPDPESRFAPGETRTGLLTPDSYDPTGADEYRHQFGPQHLQRWHFVLDSTWPCTTDGEQAPRFLPTQLHFYWDADYGFDLTLQEHESFRNASVWEPYGNSNAERHRSASFALGDCDATFLLRGWNGWCEIQVHNVSGETQYWIPMEAQPFIWLRRPGATEARPPPAAEPRPWPMDGKGLDRRLAREVRLNAGESEHGTYVLEDDSPWFMPQDVRRDYSLPWEVLLPIALPQSKIPAHDLDARRGWLRVQWDSATGFDVRLHESWPF